MISTIPDEILNYCKNEFGEVYSFRHASGGCINNGGMLETQTGRYFLKWNSADLYPEMFTKEAQGLNLLRESDTIKIPEVVSVFEGEEQACLVLEHINSTAPGEDFWSKFGNQLGLLHKSDAQRYGLDHDNFMGSLRQINDQKQKLNSFFIDCRLTPQISLAKKDNKIDVKGLTLFDQLFNKLSELLIDDSPSLVHGDLWSGNFMVGSNGEAVLIDPAVAYGHREMDIAMTRLFGGFNQAFYNAYHETCPLEAGFEERLDIYNLYPLMIHVNLFGGSCYGQVLRILKKYT